MCEVAYGQLKKGKYEVKECEATFGKADSVIETVKFSGRDGDVKLVGAIDRIDVWQNRARVIDYKTGSGGKFDYSDLYYATKLQLPMYMSVAMANGYKPGGFFYFPFASSWSDDESACMLNGVYESSDENVLAMELGSISNGATVFDMPLNKKTGLPNKKNGLSEENIKNVCDYAIRMTQNAINAIENGEFTPLPTKLGRGSLCDYCDFVGICKRVEDLSVRDKTVSDSVAKKYFVKEEA